MKINIPLIVILAFSFLCNVEAKLNEEDSLKIDSLALVDLYNSTNGPEWGKGSEGWLQDDISSWAGVTVKNGRVTELVLGPSHPVLQGNLPESIGNLTKLTKLYLYSYFTGSIPETIGNLVNLEELTLSHGFSGTIPESIGNLTKLTHLYIGSNDITGDIPKSIGNLTKLVSLNLSYNKLEKIPCEIGNLINLEILNLENNPFSCELPDCFANLDKIERLSLIAPFTGAIPASIGDMESLIYLELRGWFTGVIPESFGSLSKLSELRIQGREISGEIPSSIGNLSSLLRLYLGGNYLSGKIPESIGNLTSLVKLDLRENKLSGAIPESIGNLSNLTYFDITHNKLEKIPCGIGKLTKLTSLDLRYNDFKGELPDCFGNLDLVKRLIMEGEFTGPLPASIGEMESLTDLDIRGGNFTGGIPESFGNLSKLKYLNLRDCNLTGKIPESFVNLTALQTLVLSDNLYEGATSPVLVNLPSLTSLSIDGNLFDSISNMPVSLLKLYAHENRFDFSDLEPLANSLSYFSYHSQAELKIKKISGRNILKMDAGGKNTTYQWFYDGDSLKGEIADTCVINPENKISKYSCRAKNSLLPKLTLIGKPEPANNCWQTGELTFCIGDNEWESAAGGGLKTTAPVSISDVLGFEGKMTIDTAILELTADGTFFIDNVPYLGRYVISEGDYNLKLLGKDGIITDFINSNLKKTGDFLGTPMKLKDLQLVSRSDTLGVKVGCSINVPYLSAGCGTFSGGTNIAVNNLEITNKGVFLGGFDVQNLGLFKRICLSRLTYKYDWQKDVLIGGMDISFPFLSNLGGGFRLERGFIDSVAWNVEFDDKIPPLPIYGIMGVSGCYGHLAELNNPDLIDIKLGGIFTDLSKKVFRLTGDGRVLWPTLFEISGSGKILKVPNSELPYQVQGDIKLSFDVGKSQVRLDFKGHFGTLDEKKWLMDSYGKFTVDYRQEPTQLYGHFGGNIYLRKFYDGWPFNWFSSFVSFPIIVRSKNYIFPENISFAHGTMYFSPYENSDPYTINYILDLRKNWYELGFIKFTENGRVASKIELKSGSSVNSVTKTFNVPENNKFGVIEIKGVEKAPSSSIKSPSGKEYSTTSEVDKVLYSITDDGKSAFWSILEAEAGEWEITLNDPVQNDSVITHFQLKDKTFIFTVEKEGNIINVIWDTSQVEDNQKVTVMLDEDNKDFDGVPVKEADASSGSLSFELDESTPSCSYFVCARLSDSISFVQTYYDEEIENHLSSLSPPDNFKANYNKASGTVDFTWDVPTSSNVAGYVLTIIDEDQNDSVYAILDATQTSISLFIDNYETKTAKIEMFNHDWRTGCPSILNELTAIKDVKSGEKEEGSNLHIFPNPTSGLLTINYYVPEYSKCEIMIYNMQGNEIARLLNDYQNSGLHSVSFNYRQLPNGIYLIKYLSNSRSETVKSVLFR
jgi:Leucine-rich repeat (LRR) protein